MSFTALAFFGGSAPLDAFSTPQRVSVVLSDNGAGGTLSFNGLGDNSGSHVDLKAFFGTNFNSLVLLQAFRALTQANNNLAEAQLVKQLHVTFHSVGNVAAIPPTVAYAAGIVNGVNIPYLNVSGPSVAATWRMDIQYRYSSWY